MMSLLPFLQDAPEYIRRKNTPFIPTEVTLASLHAAVPKHLREKNTFKGLCYVFRDFICAFVAYRLGRLVDEAASSIAQTWNLSSFSYNLVRWSLWGVYWFWQSIIMTGWFSMAHEAGHGTISPHRWINHTVGFVMHTAILVPYYAWRSTHHGHHKATMNVDLDENFVPRLRSDFNLPPESESKPSDYRDALEESPLYTLLRMLVMQACGWPAYLMFNVRSSRRHPSGANHLSPYSPLFQPRERKNIVLSDLGLALMVFILRRWTLSVGFTNFVKLYLVPYLLANHWIVTFTYIQHVDPTLPYYRGKQWSFLRGALATVDRPFLGCIGRFFLHNASHNHLSHHLFSTIPFYNQPAVTEIIKEVLGDDYNYDSTGTIRAFYRSFVQCEFIEDEGDIVFYKNRRGETAREVSKEVMAKALGTD